MAVIVIVLVLVEAIDAATNYDLDAAGIEPRQVDGLDGIVWAPLLHAGWGHLWANLVPGVVLGYLVLLARRFVAVTAIVWVISGLGVWLFAPPYSVTVGASGVIFGWLTYLLVRGIFNRNLWQALLGVVLFFIYGSVLWGVFPGEVGVSWQGHLFGAIGGVGAAWFLARRDRRRRAPRPAPTGPYSPGVTP
ncbi:MAG: rhomboid family intramembrane serine protease [Gordonia sp. (in: high G+C Gram-positive bacteria)]